MMMMMVMNPIAVIKVTFEGAFDVFLELCREYCGQFRSHLSSDLIRKAVDKKRFSCPHYLVDDLLDMTLGLGGTPECLRAPTPSLVFSSLRVTRLVAIKEVVIVKMMLKMMKMMTMMMFSPPMALWQQRRASTKVL